MKINLSTTQHEIVNHIEGAVLVKAGPGSGKTRVLIERIKNILQINKRAYVLALTFSNLAADEMRERLESDSEISDEVGRVNVGTIHSFCLDLVQTRGNLIGLQSNLNLFESLSDRMTILKDVFLDDVELRAKYISSEDQNKLLNRCLLAISDQKKQFILPEQSDLPEVMVKIYAKYNERLISQDGLDFDDILFYAYRILTENSKVVELLNKQYKYISVDEAQDLNYSQYQVIKSLCGSGFKNIILVGDENQSIYGFNGSDSSLMTKSFVSDFSPAEFIMNENFRSAKAIVRFANSLEQASSSQSRYVYEGEVRATEYEDETSEACGVVKHIQTLLREGHPDVEGQIFSKDISIIGRNRYVFSAIEKELQNFSIPYCFRKTTSGLELESDYIRVLELVLRLVVNSKDIIHWRELMKLVGKDPIGVQCDVAFALSGTQYAGILDSIKLISEEMFDFKKVLNDVEKNLPPFTDDDKYLVLNDIEQFRKHWMKYAAMVPSENRTLNSFRNYVALGKTQDVSNDKGLVLLTGHMSKGLQFEAVFIVGLSEGTFPDYRAVEEGEKQMEQEYNNMYVAVTRAKRLCYLSYPKRKKMPWGSEKKQYASRFIKNLL